METTTKFCINCKHLKATRCTRPDGLSLVTGELKFVDREAESERGYNTTGCGASARYFTLKSI
jgi:hypothetical protein